MSGKRYTEEFKIAIDPDNYKPPTMGTVLRKDEASANAAATTPYQVQQGEEQTMRNVIRLGDATSHGGKVVSSSTTHFKVHGVPVACVGDTCSCPIPGHDNCTITTGSPHHLIGGKQIAFDGDGLSCGAKLISSIKNFNTTN